MISAVHAGCCRVCGCVGHRVEHIKVANGWDERTICPVCRNAKTLN